MADSTLFRGPLTEQYRPQAWADVVGQDKIVQRIQALAKRGLAGRAYWISGQSGTGKTTIARTRRGIAPHAGFALSMRAWCLSEKQG